MKIYEEVVNKMIGWKWGNIIATRNREKVYRDREREKIDK